MAFKLQITKEDVVQSSLQAFSVIFVWVRYLSASIYNTFLNYWSYIPMMKMPLNHHENTDKILHTTLERLTIGEGVRISKFWDGRVQPLSWDISIGMLYTKIDRLDAETLRGPDLGIRRGQPQPRMLQHLLGARGDRQGIELRIRRSDLH
jgi:hypothetical protein